MKKILILLSITFSSSIICMEQPPMGAELELFEAINNGNAQKVQQLIDEGVAFKVTRMYKEKEENPLNFAMGKGNQAIISILQEAYKTTADQRFLAAIKEGDISKIKKIIINAPITNVDKPMDDEGNTALLLAVQKNNIPLVKELLLWKANTTITNAKKESALILAITSKNNSSGLVATLLDYAYLVDIDQRDNNDNTLLMLAVETNDIDIIKKVVAEVPNPFLINGNGKSAKNLVKKTANKEAILELLDDAEKQYELFEAIAKRNFGDIKKSTAQLNISSAEGNPLVVAIQKKNKNLVEAILEKGANVNQILRGNRSPLSMAVEGGNIDTFKLLLEKGADPNIADIYDGYTTIFLTLFYQSPVRLQQLINHKETNINYQANSQFPGVPGSKTPLMLAVQEVNFDFVEILLGAGADPLMKNSEGKTALDIAREIESKLSNAFSFKDTAQKIISLLEKKIATLPIRPSKPTEPTKPTKPATKPSKPTEPIKPTGPTEPIKPSEPKAPQLSELMSLLHNFTQRLEKLRDML